jgi:hypothetical protein
MPKNDNASKSMSPVSPAELSQVAGGICIEIFRTDICILEDWLI